MRIVKSPSSLKHFREDRINSLFVFHLALMLVKNMLVATNSVMFGLNDSLNMIILVLLAGCYLYVLVKEKFFLHISRTMLLSLLLLFTFILISILRIPGLFQNEGVKHQFRTFISYCLPLYILSFYVKNTDDLMARMYHSIPILFIVACVCFVFSLQSKLSLAQTGYNESYSMSYGYSVLFISLLCLFKFVDIRKSIDLFLFCVTVLFIVISGSRGPIVYLGFAIVFCFITDERIKTVYKIGLAVFTLLLSVLLFLNFDIIINIISNLMERIGLPSRTLSYLSSGQIVSDSGRGEIYVRLLSRINKSPFFGIGAFGGEYTVYLSHNLYYDFFANFGYVFGSIFIITLLFSSIVYMVSVKGTTTFSLLGMMFVLVFGGGFFSESFFGTKELWILMGLLLSRHSSKKKNTATIMLHSSSKTCE